MKKKNSYRPQNAKISTKSIPKAIGIKLGILLAVIIPIAAMVAYAMNINFFSITGIISIFVLIISMIAYVKGEVIYSHPKVVHSGSTLGNKKNIVQKKHNTNFSFSLDKGTIQVVLSILIIIFCTYLGLFIYKTIG